MLVKNTKINEFIMKLESNSALLTKQQRRTLIGQATKGEVDAAEKGLLKLLKRNGFPTN